MPTDNARESQGRPRTGGEARPAGQRPGRPGRPGQGNRRGGANLRGTGNRGHGGNRGRGAGPRTGTPGGGRASAHPRQSELDRALAAAQATPAPPPTTFRALGLPAPLVDALAAQGINEPFAIQARALPDALAGRDVLGRAQTGSGKTLAFSLPMLARLAGGPRRSHAPRGLVLVPTRELAKQVANVLEPLGSPLGVTATTVYGGASMNVQISRLRQGIDIVVATPGRLIDLLERGAVTLSQVEIAVIDEADHMADLGFYPAVSRILGETPAGGQRLLFSATLDRDVERLVAAYLGEPALHAVAPVADVATAADHQVFVLPQGDKLAVAAELAGRPDRTLFFVRTKHGAARLAKQLTNAGTRAAAIHGNLNQNQRHRALTSFAEGDPRVLVATDVAARGLHIDDVGLVVHFDPPHDHKDYLHRSGRTARAGATGTVVALVDPGQAVDVAKLHDAAGITSRSHQVGAGHPAVREVATAGVPIPPPPARPVPDRAAARRGGGADQAGARRGGGADRAGARRGGGAGRAGARGGSRPSVAGHGHGGGNGLRDRGEQGGGYAREGRGRRGEGRPGDPQSGRSTAPAAARRPARPGRPAGGGQQSARPGRPHQPRRGYREAS